MKADARAQPGVAQPVALGQRTPDPVAELALGDDDRGVAGDLQQGRLVDGDDRRAARHRLEHRQTEPLVLRRLDETRRAAVELDEIVLLDVAAEVGAVRTQLGGERLILPDGPATTSGSPTAAAASSAASWFLRAWTAPTAST